jgi:plasmid stabilization system protein ParE
MNITWSDTAEKDFKENIDFLFLKWNDEVVKDFTFETERVLKIIMEQPKAFQSHKKRNVHFVPITKQITLYYDIKKNEIVLLRFWNTLRNPKTIKL